MTVKFEKKGAGVFMLDVKGYVCPHPQIYTKKALEKIKDGEVLEVLFDNPSSGESIMAMCQSRGDEIIGKHKIAGEQEEWKIRKAAGVQ